MLITVKSKWKSLTAKLVRMKGTVNGGIKYFQCDVFIVISPPLSPGGYLP